MKQFKDIITLNKNNRGCYILDTVKGCSCLKDNTKGCYNNCYAANIASRYGFDFSKITNREFIKNKEQLYLFDFYDTTHENKIIEEIKKINMPFVRIGEMGDPSDNWKHTIDICKIISQAKKPIVIITKHWQQISDNLLKEISKLNICINTSISALDTQEQIKHRLNQYNRLKSYCKSVLRIVSCEFNKENHIGYEKDIIQNNLFNNEKVIDTVFRPCINNQLVIDNVIKIQKVKFLKQNSIASVFNKNTYFGNCEKCPEMCGVNL